MDVNYQNSCLISQTIPRNALFAWELKRYAKGEQAENNLRLNFID